MFMFVSTIRLLIITTGHSWFGKAQKNDWLKLASCIFLIYFHVRMDHACTSVHVHHIEKLVCCVSRCGWVRQARADSISYACMHASSRSSYIHMLIHMYVRINSNSYSWVISLGPDSGGRPKQPGRNVVTFRDGEEYMTGGWWYVRTGSRCAEEERETHSPPPPTTYGSLLSCRCCADFVNSQLLDARFGPTPSWTRSYNNCIEMIINQSVASCCIMLHRVAVI